MGFLDFLWQGEAPPSVTKYGESTENVPKWYSDFLQGIITKGTAVAGEEYQAFPGPTVAPLSADQQNAANLTRSSVGAASPILGSAQNLITGGGALSSLNAAAPYMTRAAAAPTGLNTAAPYMGKAGEAFPEAAGRYMSPYTDAVVNRIAELGNRNLTENLLPAVEDRFIGAGQSRSRRSGEFMGRAVRDVAGEIAGQQAQALERGYETAGQLFGADAGRQGALATLAGQLGDEAAGRDIKLATLSGQLAGEGAGRAITAGGALSSLAGDVQSTGLRDAAALEAVGATQQQQQQRNLDAAYQRFLEERGYPREQVEWLNAIARGMQVPKSTTTTYNGPLGNEMGPSPLATLASMATGIAGLKQAGLFRRGGRVPRYARGGRVRGALTTMAA